eukprot:g918.t1
MKANKKRGDREDGPPVGKEGEKFDMKERIKKQLGKYHDALLRGRHPKSFPTRSSVFWEVIGTSTSRMRKVRSGQHFRSVYHTGDSEGNLVEDAASPDSLSRPWPKRGGVNVSKLDQFLSRERRASSVSSIGLVGSVDSKSVCSAGGRRRNRGPARHFHKKLMTNLAANVARIRTEQKVVLAGEQSEAKLFYGSKVAFEQQSVQGLSLWLTLTPQGRFIVAPRDSGMGQYIFTLVDLDNQSDQRPLHFGENCWMGISAGLGEKWQQGGVVGSKMTHAVNLIEDSHREDQTMGTAIPIAAYMPSDFEHRMGRSDHKERLEKNTTPLAIGKWKFQPALRSQKHFNLPSKSESSVDHSHHQPQPQLHPHRRRHHHHHHHHNHHRQKRADLGKQLFNMARVYIEQDWFILTTEDSKKKKALDATAVQEKSDRIFLRKLTTTHDEHDRNLVAASGIWTIHAVETQSGTIGTGKKSSSASKAENLLYRARMQLNKSKDMRDGATEYEKLLQGGSKFPVQIRRLRQNRDTTQTLQFFDDQDTESRQHLAKGRSKQTWPHRQHERILKSHEKRTRIARAADDFLSDTVSLSRRQAAMRAASVADSNDDTIVNAFKRDEDAKKRRHQAIALSEWFKKKCGADLGKVHDEIAKDLLAPRDSMDESQRLTLRRGREEQDHEQDVPVEELEIYRRLLEEDARAARIFKHRQENTALVDLYATLFTDVEY